MDQFAPVLQFVQFKQHLVVFGLAFGGVQKTFDFVFENYGLGRTEGDFLEFPFSAFEAGDFFLHHFGYVGEVVSVFVIWS